MPVYWNEFDAWEDEDVDDHVDDHPPYGEEDEEPRMQDGKPVLPDDDDLPF
jgi:hypothetical protein